MIRRHPFALQLTLIAADALVAVLVFLAARFVRFGEADPSQWAALNLDLRFGLALYAVVWVTTLWFLGLYAFRVRWAIASEFNDILVATLIDAFAILSFLYLVKVDVSRLFLLLVLTLQPVATMAGRLVVRLGFNRLHTRGHNCYFDVSYWQSGPGVSAVAPLREGGRPRTDAGGCAETLIRGHLFTLRVGLMAAEAATAALLFWLVSTFRFGPGQWTRMWDAFGQSEQGTPDRAGASCEPR